MAEANRETVIDAFLTNAGWGAAERRSLAADASFRRYDRVTDGGRQAVLMDAPPGKEDVRPFVAVARYLHDLGLSAPQILAEDVERGLLLLQDFGDDTYTRVLVGEPGRERGLYELAIDSLIELHRKSNPENFPAELPTYDDDRLLDEACLLTDWYLPAMTGRKIDADARDEYCALWRETFAAVHAEPRTIVLRDYHIDNLMVVPGRTGVAACGLLDFQDAVSGPAAYDVMSLLEDARRDIAAPLTVDMLARYMAAFPELSPGSARRQAFQTAFATLAAQRHAKVIGIFTRLCVRDAKPSYLVHIPRVWRLLEASLGDPALASLGDWLQRNLPKDLRGIPPVPETMT